MASAADSLRNSVHGGIGGIAIRPACLRHISTATTALAAQCLSPGADKINSIVTAGRISRSSNSQRSLIAGDKRGNGFPCP